MSSQNEEKQQIIIITLLIHNVLYLVLCYYDVINENSFGTICLAVLIQLYLMHLMFKYKCFMYLGVKIQKYIGGD